jgi:HK97 family phage prohead protease
MSKENDYIKKIDEQAERRFLTAPVTAEKRDAAIGTELIEVVGYAALYDSPTTLGWYEESIAPGAFDDVMQDDVRCLFNHDPNFVLARSQKGQGTLKLELDSKGLRYSYTTPDRQFAKDLQDMILTGDVSQSSFSFRVKLAEWTYAEGPGEMDKRRITKLERLYDVAPVTYPAYADTSIAKRSADAARPAPKKRRLNNVLKSKIQLATI